MLSHRVPLAMVAAAVLGSATPAVEAQTTNPRTLRVGVVENAMPCSGFNNGQPEGSAVDLWQSMAQREGWSYTYQPIRTNQAAVEAAARGEVDLAVSCLNIIAERLQQADFSVPYQEDSLAFLSHKRNEGLLSLLQRISREQILRDSILILFAITMVAATALWLIGRGFNHKDILGTSSRQTFFKGWMMLVMGSGIYKMGPNPPAMAIITLTNICRLVITSVFVGTTATLVFKASLPTDVSQKDSLLNALRGKVGVDAGTVSELWLKEQASRLNQPQLMANIKPISGDAELLNALQTNTVGSIMADSNRIKVLSQQIKDPNQYQISAKTYNLTPQSFVFGRTLSSAQRNQINQLISQKRFNGSIETIIKRWNAV
jgi:ABC-type amino acid transport substrate-binding protein